MKLPAASPPSTAQRPRCYRLKGFSISQLVVSHMGWDITIAARSARRPKLLGPKRCHFEGLPGLPQNASIPRHSMYAIYAYIDPPGTTPTDRHIFHTWSVWDIVCFGFSLRPSPPYKGKPQVTTDPSASRAAKVPQVPQSSWTSCN